MRLIDADELIQHSYSAVIDGVETDIIDVSNVDNAPTVEERPQGEWVFTDDDYGFWHCNQCKTVGSPHNNFCPNCGASMKPKTCTNCETFGGGCGDCEVGDDD